MLHIVGFLDWICWIQYHIFLPSERTIPVVLKDTDLFEQIFSKILEECMKFKLVDTEQIFVDSTHVKACANSKKMRKRVAHEQALWYEQELKEEIQKDREAHGKRPLKDNDKNKPLPPTTGGGGSLSDETDSQIPEGAKHKSAAPVIRKAVGFVKENINMFLHMR